LRFRKFVVDTSGILGSMFIEIRYGVGMTKLQTDIDVLDLSVELEPLGFKRARYRDAATAQ
jgi:hypothetical protein